jgi:hypothetical protein
MTALIPDPHLGRPGGRGVATAPSRRLPEKKPEIEKYAAKKTQEPSRIAGQASKFWNYGRFRR